MWLPWGKHRSFGRWLWVILPDLPVMMDIISYTSFGIFKASTEMFGKNNRGHGSSNTLFSRFASMIVRKSVHSLSLWQNGCDWPDKICWVLKTLVLLEIKISFFRLWVVLEVYSQGTYPCGILRKLSSAMQIDWRIKELLDWQVTLRLLIPLLLFSSGRDWGTFTNYEEEEN